jgi:hypothetical protein
MNAAVMTGRSGHAEQRVSPTLDRQVRTWLRLEGLAALIAGTVAYGQFGGDWLWFIPAMLAVDVSLAGYLRGPVIGATIYNLAHNWALGLLVLGIGMALGIAVVTLVGVVLIAHVGMDRAVGYGLKLTTSAHDTHLGRMGGREPAARAEAVTPAMLAAR